MATKQSSQGTIVKAHTRGLARTFRRLAEKAERLEHTATHILNAVSETKVRDVESFDKLVRAAYQQNGWNERPGRPSSEGQAATAVPPVVRTYVSEVRAAIRLGLDVSRFESFYQLRTALRERRENNTRPDRRLRQDANLLCAV